MPCNSIPDEILFDLPKRFRGMWVKSDNQARSLADGSRKTPNRQGNDRGLSYRSEFF